VPLTERPFASFTASDVETPLLRMARSWPVSCQAGIVAVGGLRRYHHRDGDASDQPVVMAVALGVPVLTFAAVTAYEWRAGRRLGIELSRLHLAGVPVGLAVWLIDQTAPGGLPFDPTSAQPCEYVGHPLDRACLVQADAAGRAATSPGGRPVR
jgi:hypothetical protein